ncbi:MAG: NADH-quinone oxidoreductase subunit A [Desulfovibrionales bacterium]
MELTWLNVAILLFFGAGIVFAGVPLLVSLLVSPKIRGGEIGETYECGVPTSGPTWIRFGVNYYFYALIFLAFDVDVLYLFPVAAYYAHSEGWLPFFKVLLFIVILAAPSAYFWRKGVFTWPKRIKI